VKIGEHVVKPAARQNFPPASWPVATIVERSNGAPPPFNQVHSFCGPRHSENWERSDRASGRWTFGIEEAWRRQSDAASRLRDAKLGVAEFCAGKPHAAPSARKARGETSDETNILFFDLRRSASHIGVHKFRGGHNLVRDSPRAFVQLFSFSPVPLLPESPIVPSSTASH